MDIQLVAKKLLDFCKDRYPELKWSFTSLSKTEDMIYGYCPILNSINGIQIDIRVNSNNSYNSDGSPSDFKNYIEGRSTISNLDWEGSFLAWINDRKNSKILFKKSGTAKHKELNLWREKGTQIMINVFEFIENKIQTDKPRRIDILQKIAAFCHKKYNDNSDWNSWSFKSLFWSEWELKFDQQIYLIGNAKVLLDSQTIAHIKVMCHYRDSDDLPVVKVKSRIFDLRTVQIKEIYKYIGFSYHESLYSDIENPDKQNEIDFICDKTDEIVEAISSFIKTINQG